MKTLIYILVVLLLASCYEDKGNYDYKEINSVDVSLNEVYAVRLGKDTTVTIIPQLSQSLQENTENLKYAWLHSTINEMFYAEALSYNKDLDTVGTEENLRFHIDPNEKNLKYEHYFRLNVYDEITGIEYPANTIIKLIKPYNGAWMVLHAKDGQTKLGAVEYIDGDIQVRKEAFYNETGKRFAGKPLCLGQYTTSSKYYGYGSSWNMFYVITDVPTEAGVYCQWKGFEKKDSLSRMVAPMARSGFDYQNIKLLDGDGSASALLLSNNVLYQIPRAGKVYKPGTKLEGEMKITLASKVSNTALLYDEAGHRFAFYYNTSNGSGVKKYDPLYFSEGEENVDLIQEIPIRDGNVSVVNPNKLSPDQKVLYVGVGYQYDQDRTQMYGYALAKSEDKCCVYEFNSKGFTDPTYASFNGYYQFELPQNLDENSHFVSSPPYSGIIFYASRNKVYRLDFKQSGGKAKVIYTHPGGKVSKMKFAKRIDPYPPKDFDFTAYQFDMKQSLGVSFDMGNGTSDFVILNLSSTGSVGADSEDYPALQVYPDFGEIVDFVFI